MRPVLALLLNASVMTAVATVTATAVNASDAETDRTQAVIESATAIDCAARDWKSIIVHHSATDGGDVAAIDRVHKSRRDSNGEPWLGIGYHFVIGNGNGMPDGDVEATFRWKGQLDGAHAGSKMHNATGIGVCLIGNFEKVPPTAAQVASLKRLLSELKSEHGISPSGVKPHRAIKSTKCPGKLFPADLLSSAGVRTTLSDQRRSSLSSSPASGRPLAAFVSARKESP